MIENLEKGLRWFQKTKVIKQITNHKKLVEPSIEDLKAYAEAQNLTRSVLETAAQFVHPGQTEIEVSQFMKGLFQQRGVNQFFHEPFAWFGQRTAFHGIHKYKDFMPTQQKLSAREVFILDAAPIVNGYIVDMGLTFCLNENPELSRMQATLENLKREIPLLFSQGKLASEIWQSVHQRIESEGWINCHQKYPFSVLGHRVYQSHPKIQPTVLKFGLSSLNNMIMEGLFSEILSPDSHFIPEGLWAIEPHLGSSNQGAKFEELLWVKDGRAQWLSEQSSVGF